jgi:DNA helicase HerA-like ATPase
VVVDFWGNEFEKWDARFKKEAIAPIQNKIGQFLGDPLIRSILGQSRSRLNIRMAMDKQKILIVNLSKGLVGESVANLFGSLIVSAFHEAALSRAEIDESKRTPFLLVVDEFQNVVTTRFASMLSEARKYGLGMVLSHQYLDQLLPDLQSAVLGNTATMLLFRTGGKDAAILSRELGNNSGASIFMDLQPYHAILYGGDHDIPVARVVKTSPPLGIKNNNNFEIFNSISRERYSQPKNVISRRQRSWFDRRF